MPINTFLTRIKNNFFSILLPGFYTFFLIVFGSWAILSASSELPFSFERIDYVIKNPNVFWSILLGILMVSFLIGNVFRAATVNTADRFGKLLFSWMATKKWEKIRYQDDFPYKPILAETAKHIHDEAYYPTIKGFNETELHSLFNFWKIVLCEKAPNAFFYCQSFEERVRLFSGMFWSGLIGILITGFVFFRVFGDWSQWSTLWASGYLAIVYVLLILSLFSIFGFSVVGESKLLTRHWVKTVLPILFWVAFICFIALCIGSIYGQTADTSTLKVILNSSLFVVSSILVFLFGSNLRRVRGQEAEAVFMSYISLPKSIWRPQNPQELNEPPRNHTD